MEKLKIIQGILNAESIICIYVAFALLLKKLDITIKSILFFLIIQVLSQNILFKILDNKHNKKRLK